jgi:hypothetical protein
VIRGILVYIAYASTNSRSRRDILTYHHRPAGACGLWTDVRSAFPVTGIIFSGLRVTGCRLICMSRGICFTAHLRCSACFSAEAAFSRRDVSRRSTHPYVLRRLTPFPVCTSTLSFCNPRQASVAYPHDARKWLNPGLPRQRERDRHITYIHTWEQQLQKCCLALRVILRQNTKNMLFRRRRQSWHASTLQGAWTCQVYDPGYIRRLLS